MSPDGRRLADMPYEQPHRRHLNIWDRQTGRSEWIELNSTYWVDDDRVHSSRFSQNGELLLVSVQHQAGTSSFPEALLIHAASGELLVHLKGGGGLPSQSSISDNGRRMLTLSSAGIAIWDLTDFLAKPRIAMLEAGPEITWYLGTLQFAPTVDGLWTDLPAASPMPLSPIGEKGFFRVKVEE